MKNIGALDIGGNFHGSVLGMVLEAGLVVKFALLILLVLSIVSWTIIFIKFRYYRKIRKENELFDSDYHRSGKLADVLPASKKYSFSTTAEVFRSGYAELTRMNRAQRETSRGDEINLSSLDNVQRALNRSSSTEATKLESALGFLATTASVSPFIGLFGTVWGIMETFQSIGARGSATLAVVAPGISEALIATAAGLAAAIPAVIFYNYFLNKARTMVQEMDNFADEFLNIVERYLIGK